MKVRRKSKLFIEVCETNRKSRHKYKLSFNIPNQNQLMLGAKSPTFYPSLIWKNVPYHNKWAENLNIFKDIMTVGDEIKTKKKTMWPNHS